jgi:hypothetical protein
MSRRLALILVIAALVAQTLAVVPFAFAANGSWHSASSDCPDHHAPSSDRDCPCCPDGLPMVAGCMSLCAAFAPGYLFASRPNHSNAVTEIAFVAPFSLTRLYQPLNPPPISR